MSERERFDERVWDRVFDALSARDEALSDAEIEEELKRAGIDSIAPALQRVRQALEASRGGDGDDPPRAAPEAVAERRDQPHRELKVGASVVKCGDRSACGTVVAEPRKRQGELWYPVRFTGKTVENVRADDLEVYEGEQDLRTLLSARSFASHRAFARRMTMSKLRKPLREAIYALGASRTEFLPHQFRPLLKFLSSDRGRLLIADEVGLGKTIEAGFILQEQKARHGIDRVLVVCPASLRTKWQREMWGRFREEFDVLSSDTLRSKVLDRRDENSRRRVQAIVSLQTLRSESALKRLEEQAPSFDLIIVDEAHHCRNSDTKQHRAIRALNAEAESVVFLTATPLSIRNENLFNLLRLLLPEEFDRLDVFESRLEANRHIVAAESLVRRLDAEGMTLARQSLDRLSTTHEGRRVTESALYREVREHLERIDVGNRRAVIDLQDSLSQLNLLSHVMTRTRKREVYAKGARRQATVLRVKMTPYERDIYERVSAYCFNRYVAAGNDFAARFAVITLQRQLASSVHAALDHYGELIDADSGNDPVDDEIETFEDDEAVDDLQDGETFSIARKRLVDDSEFRTIIRECRAARGGQKDSKLRQLVTLLESGEKVVVFSYFKRSLRYLERELTQRGIGCVRIDGDVPTNPQNPEEDERILRIEAFRDRKSISVLLSSEVGSEGLDFQFCHRLVNWDLPWNPMVVEQRIGRLDRLGQRAERILIFNFSAPDTIEDRILDRLYDRVGLFEGAIGVLEPILGEQIKRLTERLFNVRLTPEERDRIIEEAAVALERQLKEERKLDEASASLLGQDEIFAEHLEETKRLGRYVTPEEARLFVTDFLATEYPESRLRPPTKAKPDVWRMPVTSGLRKFVQGALTPDDVQMQRFLERCGAAELLVTFRSNVALDSQSLEFLHAQHPLVRAIAKFYEAHADRIHPACAVQVESDAVPEGDYFFLWTRVNETGLQAGTSLWAECVSVNGELHPEPEQTEQLLHHMIVRGEPFDPFEPPSPEEVAALYDACEDAIYERITARKVEAKKVNEGRVEARLASLQASYEVRRAETQRRLETAQLSGNQRAIQLFEAQLRTKESTHRHKREELESKRQVAVSAENPEGAGFVRVIAPRGPLVEKR